MESFDIEDEEIGILLGIEFDEDHEIEVEYNIRVLEGVFEGDVKLDGRYKLENFSAEKIIDEMYPAIINQFESSFPDAEIQYHEI